MARDSPVRVSEVNLQSSISFRPQRFQNFEMELAFPPALATYETIARVATVIRYDFRNTGLSTRGVEDVSIRAHIRDLDAVRRHFRLESAVLVFPFASARIALEYAAAQPERVTALMRWSPELHRETGLRIQGVADLLQAALRIGPEAYASILAVIVVGLESHANTAWLARYLFESANADDWIRTSAAVDHRLRVLENQVSDSLRMPGSEGDGMRRARPDGVEREFRYL